MRYLITLVILISSQTQAQEPIRFGRDTINGLNHTFTDTGITGTLTVLTGTLSVSPDIQEHQLLELTLSTNATKVEWCVIPHIKFLVKDQGRSFITVLPEGNYTLITVISDCDELKVLENQLVVGRPTPEPPPVLSELSKQVLAWSDLVEVTTKGTDAKLLAKNFRDHANDVPPEEMVAKTFAANQKSLPITKDKWRAFFEPLETYLNNSTNLDLQKTWIDIAIGLERVKNVN